MSKLTAIFFFSLSLVITTSAFVIAFYPSAPSPDLNFVSGPVEASLLVITSPATSTRGVGYLAFTDGQVKIISVAHVVSASMRINRLSDGFEIAWNNLNCLDLKNDSPCQISSDLGSAVITRDVSAIPAEVSIYDRNSSLWLTFKVINLELGENLFAIQGLPIDLDSDGITDFQAKVCRGMSGLPAIESQQGVLIRDQNGRFISRGELALGIDPIGDCTFTGGVFNQEF